MKTLQARSYFLVAGSLLITSACSSQGVTLIHPQSGATVQCTGSGFGMGAGWVQSYVGECARRNESRGYVPLEKLTPEQREQLERRGLLPQV